MLHFYNYQQDMELIIFKTMVKEKTIKVKDYQTKADMRYADFSEFVKAIPEVADEWNDAFLTMRILKIFYNINPKDGRNLKQEQTDLLLDKVQHVLNLPKSEFRNVIEMGDKLYGFIPNFSKITTGELIDIEDRFRESDFISLTSILYRPIIGEIDRLGQYEIEPYDGYDNKFKDVSLDIVEGYLDFFQKSYQQLSNATHISI